MLLWYFSCQTVLFMPILTAQIHFKGKRKDIARLMRRKTLCRNLAVKIKKSPGL